MCCVSVWLQCRCAQYAYQTLCRIKLLEAVDHTVVEDVETEQAVKKKAKKRRKKAPREPPPTESETGERQEAGQVKKILMVRTENVIHDPFEQTEEVKVCLVLSFRASFRSCTYITNGNLMCFMYCSVSLSGPLG